MDDLERLTRAIAAMEAQRHVLGDEVVDSALGPLRAEVDRLRGLPVTQQRRLVTVLFADLAGFTELSDRLDPEDVQQIMSAYFGRWKAQIEHYGGRVEKFIGDAVMAVFGLAAAREDDAENAVRAALAMGGELEKLNNGWRARRVDLAMRVGIHTGVVVVSQLADRREGEFVAVGDTVNVASRLQSIAPPGGVLVSHDTHTHVRGLFETQDLSPQAIKGKTELLRAHLILRARPRTFESSARGPNGADTRFVGRERELEALRQAYRDTWAQGSRLVLVTGDTGLGKSRLLLEFAHRAEREVPGVLWLKGRAFPHTRAVPYALLRSVFASHFEIRESDSSAAARAKFERGAAPFFLDRPEVKVPMLGACLGYDFPSPHISSLRDDPEQLRDRALSYLAELLSGMAFGARLVIALDDAHWSDSQSLAAVGHALRQTEGKFLVIALTRPSQADQPGQLLSGEAILPDRFVRIDLDPLSSEDTRLLATDILRSTPPIAESTLALVVRRAEGNPYFLEELLRMLGERTTTPAESSPTGSDDMSAMIPTTLTGVLQARLDSLPPPEKAILQQASVVGRVFWRSALEYLGAAEAPSADSKVPGDLMRSLVRRQLVFCRPHSTFEGTDEFIFKHALLQETSYETVLRRDRVPLHERTARWLEAAASRAGRSDEFAAVIAQHLERAGSPDVAGWYLRAGKHAAVRFANADALRLLEKALALAADDERDLRFEILLTREEVHKVTADRPSQAEDLRFLTGLARDLGDQARMAVVSLRSAHHAYVTADFDAALTAADAARELAGALGLAGVEGEANTVRAKVLWRRGDYAEARSAGTRGLELAHLNDDWSLRANCLEALALISAHEGKYAEAMHLEREALALTRAGGDVAREASALGNLGNLAWYMGDAEEARKHLMLSLDLRREIGDRRGQSRVLTSLGNVESDQGELESSLRYQMASLEISRSIEDLVGTSTALANLGDQFRMLGQYERGHAHLAEALHLHRRIGNRNAECIVMGNLGLLHLAQGRSEDAERYLAEGLARARQLSANHLVAHMSTYLGRVRMEQGMYDSAEELLCGALSAGEAAVVPEATAGLALLHRARGNLVQALVYAERIGVLDSHEVGRADDPTWVMLARYLVLQELGSDDAEAALGAAWQRVQAVADRIKDPALRASYLSANTTNRLLATCREHNSAAATPTAGLHDATDAGGSGESGDADDEEQHAGGPSSGGAPPHRSEEDHANSGH